MTLSPAPPGRTERLAPDDAGAVDDVLAIYRDAIPASERKPAAELRGMLASPDYLVCVHRAGSTVLAFAAFFAPAGGTFALLEYAAVDARYRGAGVGGALVRASLGMLRRDRPGSPVVVEVEAAGEDGGPAHIIRQRRQAFYRRLGCLKVDGLVYQLPLAADPPPPAMEWMVWPAGADRAVAKSVLGAWLRAIYVRVYNRPADDPRIAVMLAPLADPVPLR